MFAPKGRRFRSLRSGQQHNNDKDANGRSADANGRNRVHDVFTDTNKLRDKGCNEDGVCKFVAFQNEGQIFTVCTQRLRRCRSPAAC